MTIGLRDVYKLMGLEEDPRAERILQIMEAPFIVSLEEYAKREYDRKLKDMQNYLKRQELIDISNILVIASISSLLLALAYIVIFMV